jgi:heat shock protein HtpX
VTAARTARREGPAHGWRGRLPAAVLLVISAGLTIGWLQAWGADQGSVRTAPWWAYLFLVLLSVATVSLAAAVTIDPKPLIVRRALAGIALAWAVILGAVVAVLLRTDDVSRPIAAVVIGALAAVTVALAGIGLTTDPETLPGDRGWIPRLAAVTFFGASIVMATGVVVVFVSAVRLLWRWIANPQTLERMPWVLVVIVILLPVVTFGIAMLNTRRSVGETFWSQAASNRRNSALLLVTIVGILAGTAEIIAASVTYRAVPALWAAVVAAVVGVLIAANGIRFGSEIILETAGAKRADPLRHRVLLDVVAELSTAAAIPPPSVFVIDDESQNAFATGRDPGHASLAVTTGLLERMDREELQGIIGHELGHIRNLDTRYALYVAVMVGLVALVTDGFLQVVVEGWKNGVFFWSSDDEGALAALATGLLVGLFLLIVAALLRIVAPLFSALVQASTTREREFLADATSVEFTRNPRGLERALAAIATDSHELHAANRGTQHLWFRNPVKAGSDRRAGLFSTHPSIEARIDRLRALQGLEPLTGEAANVPAGET